MVCSSSYFPPMTTIMEVFFQFITKKPTMSCFSFYLNLHLPPFGVLQEWQTWPTYTSIHINEMVHPNSYITQSSRRASHTHSSSKALYHVYHCRMPRVAPSLLWWHHQALLAGYFQHLGRIRQWLQIQGRCHWSLKANYCKNICSWRRKLFNSPASNGLPPWRWLLHWLHHMEGLPWVPHRSLHHVQVHHCLRRLSIGTWKSPSGGLWRLLWLAGMVGTQCGERAMVGIRRHVASFPRWWQRRREHLPQFSTQGSPIKCPE